MVTEDDTTKVITAHMVSRKGLDEYSINRLAQGIKGLGYNRIMLTSDQEPSILPLRAEVKTASQVEIVPEESAVGESQSNGQAGIAVMTVKGQFRT